MPSATWMRAWRARAAGRSSPGGSRPIRGGWVRMLGVVVGDARCARVILAYTALLVAASLVPGLFGLGLAYLVPASIGGGWFLARSVALPRHPPRRGAPARGG